MLKMVIQSVTTAAILIVASAKAQAHNSTDRWVKLPANNLTCKTTLFNELQIRHDFLIKDGTIVKLPMNGSAVAQAVSQCREAVAQAKAVNEAVMVNFNSGEVAQASGLFIQVPPTENQRTKLPSNDLGCLATPYNAFAIRYGNSVSEELRLTLNSSSIFQRLNQCRSAILQAQASNEEVLIDSTTGEVEPASGFFVRDPSKSIEPR